MAALTPRVHGDAATGGQPAGSPADPHPKPPAAHGTAAPPAPPRGITLGSPELRGILRIVEDCEQATTLPVFRQAALEGLARYLGYRHAAFFVGSSVEGAFQDRESAGHGLGLQMADAFQERYRTLEAFIAPDDLSAIKERGLLTLDEFGPPGRPEIRLYLQRFLKLHGIRAKLLVRLTTPAGTGGFVSLSDPRPGAFGPRDRAVCSVLGRHLGNLLTFHTRALPGPAVTAKLSVRERDVVRLVAEGHANRQVADALCISVDTVKHHVRHAMEATGYANRTQLALAWQREVGVPAVPGPAVPPPTSAG